MALNIWQPLLLLTGAGASSAGYLFLDDYGLVDEKIADKRRFTKREVTNISSFEDIMDFQRSKGCNFWFVGNWGKQEVWNALKIRDIIKQEGDNKNRADGEIQKAKDLFTFLNGSEKDKCTGGAQLTYAYESQSWKAKTEEAAKAAKP
ncbi:hypothetical protein MHF_1432 [Mycoplasma haemofelis Ohio2]|uniref:Uncharacterized protein n=1 Tax=Mycoplasma haemofelis (strain Ohio2) TaxID=859194 RepID=F6FGM8_MYCHI|nr:hypothetical protein MHF_1432 [Mycoplasma haemofelis Ohio2]